MIYTTFGELQAELKSFFVKTGEKLQFLEALGVMEKRGMMSREKPESVFPDDYENMSDKEFDHLVDTLPISFEESDFVMQRQVAEKDLFPLRRDVFVIRHPRYTRPYVHSHNYFEMDYVIQGSMSMLFENEPERQLRAGEFCIIAPGSKHDLYTEDDSTISIIICIRKSTFNTVFFQQLAGQDLLAYFFRTILHEEGRPNLLMFYTEGNRRIVRYLRHALVECSFADDYSNNACINMMQLMFIELLRNYSKTIRFYNYEMGSDFSLVLQYIQHNYRHLTLTSLSEFFHYSEPHLCTLIRKNTGHTFSDLIRQLRLADAQRLLANTDMKIQEIADAVGYNSADHFSRVFRSAWHMSPAEYRKKNRKAPDFVPFRTEQDSE